MDKEESVRRPRSGRGGYLEALLNACPDAIIATDAEGKITFANKVAAKLVDRDLHDLIGESIVTVYENLEAARETNRKLYISGGVVHDHESRARTKSGKVVPVRISASHLQDSSGNYIGSVGYFQTYRPWSVNEIKAKEYSDELEARLEEWQDVGTPIFELYPGLSVVVIVGRLNVTRFDRITKNMLSHVKEAKTRVTMIDLSAALLSNGDTALAGQLVKAIRTLRLLGSECVLAGIQSSLAQAMEPLITDLSLVKSYSRTEVALDEALKCAGFEIRKK